MWRWLTIFIGFLTTSSFATTDEQGLILHSPTTALGRLLAVTNALGKATTYGYDELGSLISQTDANNHTTTFEFDSMGRRIKRTLPGGQVETSAYDLTGNLTNKTDFNGHVTGYAYDSLNRLLSKTPDASFGAPSVVMTYTPTGQRSSMRDAGSYTTYLYDSRDLLTNKTVQFNLPSGGTYTSILSYTYDAHGNLSHIASSDANGADVSYTYDPLNRLGNVIDPHTGTTIYGYDAVGNLAGYVYPNNVASGYTYDALNRLTNLTTVNARLSSVAYYNYTVASGGQRLTANENVVLTNGVRTINRIYTHDAAYRLTDEAMSITDPLAVPASAEVGYTLDNVGNRLARQSSISSIPSVSSGFDANDRLTGDSYDLNGNTVIGHIASSASPVNDRYDFEDRLVNRNSGQITITYDGDGNRLSKTVGGVTTLYLVDDRNPTGYPQVLEELTSTGGGPSVTRAYAYGHALISQDQFDGAAWRTSFYGMDGHNNVRYLTDSAGNLTDTYDYDAYGTLIAQSGSTPNAYLYCGEQYDADLGLYYNRARYLNTDSGRFWTMDRFAGFKIDPSSLHKYLYAHGEPTNLLDPSGLISVNELLESIGIDGEVRSSVSQLLKKETIRKLEGFVCQELKDQVVQGVYAIILDGQVYIGQSKNIQQRLKQWEKEGAMFAGALKTVTGMDNDKAQKFIRELIEQVAVDAKGGLGGRQRNNPISLQNLEDRIARYDPVNKLATAAFKVIPICKEVHE